MHPESRDIAERLRQAADEVERLDDGGDDWVNAHCRDDDIRSTDQIALICGCSSDTVRRRAEASSASGFPLGVRFCGVWMLSLRRVLIWIEQHQGRPARLAAESRAQKSADLHLRQQNEPEIA
jgi:hypothetical protein